MARELSLQHFGLVIAYLLPGFVLLWGVATFGEVESISLRLDLKTISLGEFLSNSLVSLVVGMTVSAIRWLTIDTFHHRTGLPSPKWNFLRLAERVQAFDLIVEHYYRYYQFYGNMVVSLLLVFLIRRSGVGMLFSWNGFDLGLLALAVLFFYASRDSLSRYYDRGSQLMQPRKRRQRN